MLSLCLSSFLWPQHDIRAEYETTFNRSHLSLSPERFGGVTYEMVNGLRLYFQSKALCNIASQSYAAGGVNHARPQAAWWGAVRVSRSGTPRHLALRFPGQQFYHPEPLLPMDVIMSGNQGVSLSLSSLLSLCSTRQRGARSPSTTARSRSTRRCVSSGPTPARVQGPPASGTAPWRPSCHT